MNALILVDLQNDFLPGGALAVSYGDDLIGIANELMPHFAVIAATQDYHPANHLSFASEHPGRSVGDCVEVDGLSQVLWPAHCVAGTWGSEFASELNVAEFSETFPKGTDRRRDSYSGFFDNGGVVSTGLREYLQREGIEDVYVMGLATDYCVRATAIDAAQLGFTACVIEDAVRGVELKDGDCEQAMRAMERAGVRRIRARDIDQL